MKTRIKEANFSLFLAALSVVAPRISAQSIYEPYTFATFAGAAGFNGPRGVAVDGAGNVYVVSAFNATIRKSTPAGVVTTLAGSDAQFNYPSGVAVDGVGNVYVADTGNNKIRKVTPTGVATTLAGSATNAAGSMNGMGGDARFFMPSGVAVDSAGNVYVADTQNHTIRKVTPAGVVTTLAAQFNYPSAVAVDSVGNLYVADLESHAIRKVTPAGVVTTLAGSDWQFNKPSGVVVDSAGNVYVADGDGTIRKVTPTGVVTTVDGVQGFGVAVDSANNVYVVADGMMGTGMIRKVTPAGLVTTPVGLAESPGNQDGTGNVARFSHPYGVAVDSSGKVYVADTYNRTIRKVTPAGVVTTLAGLAGVDGSLDGTGIDARFSYPWGMAVDREGNVYVADTFNDTIRKVTPAGVVTTLAGSDAQFNYPQGVAVDGTGNIYVADTRNYTIRKVTPAGVVTTLAGLAGISGTEDGTGSGARFGSYSFYGDGTGPKGVAVDSAGNIYVADTFSIRKVTPAGVVATLAGLADSPGSVDGRGNAARFAGPSGVAVDGAGNIYVADGVTIRKVTAAGVVTTLAGLAGRLGIEDGTGSGARFGSYSFYGDGGPSGVAVDSAGNVYVADTGNNTIRKGYPAPTILSSGPGFGFNGGQFGFNLTGPSGRSVVVEASTDLVSWLPLWTNTFAADLKFSDSQSGVYSNRFYRLVMP